MELLRLKFILVLQAFRRCNIFLSFIYIDLLKNNHSMPLLILFFEFLRLKTRQQFRQKFYYFTALA